MFALSAHRQPFLCIISAATSLIAATAAAQTVDIRTVALSGDSAPGTVGASFQEFAGTGRAPALNSLGNTAFFGLVTGGDTTGSNQIGLWKETPDLILVVRQGDIAPGTLDLQFDFQSLAEPLCSTRATTPLSSPTSRPALASRLQSRAFGRRTRPYAGRARRRCRSGAGEATFSGFEMPSLDDAGNIAFPAALTGGTAGFGIWKESPTLSPVMLEGDPAPGTVDGTFSEYSSLGGTLPINGSGNTAFPAAVAGGDVMAFVNDRGIWKETPDLALVARKGDVAPGADGATFNFFATFGGFDSTPSLNDLGNAAIFADLSDHREGIWKENPELSLVALEGGPAPGTDGANFAGFDNSAQAPQSTTPAT